MTAPEFSTTVVELREERNRSKQVGSYNEIDWCGAVGESGWYCTRAAHHSGPHVADTSRRVLGEWSS